MEENKMNLNKKRGTFFFSFEIMQQTRNKMHININKKRREGTCCLMIISSSTQNQILSSLLFKEKRDARLALTKTQI
jgi:hypothetical protein